jgi:hypothetical protein
MLGEYGPVGADPEGELKKALKDELVGVPAGIRPQSSPQLV